MAYLAVNKDGKEVRFEGEKPPIRWNDEWIQYESSRIMGSEGVVVEFYEFGKTQPFDTITALTGQKITFDDEPIKI